MGFWNRVGTVKRIVKRTSNYVTFVAAMGKISAVLWGIVRVVSVFNSSRRDWV